MIYCFGNSHVTLFAGAPPCGKSAPKLRRNIVQVNPDATFLASVWLGPIIAYNFTQHYLPEVLNVLNGALRERDIVMLDVGEVDCRYHMTKRAAQGEEVPALVRECATRYYEAVKTLLADGWYVVVLGTHPTTLKRYDEESDVPPEWQEDHANVFAGPPPDGRLANSVCVEWNSTLAEMCAVDSVPFVSIYNKLVDEDNRTKTEYFVDYCHLSYELTFPMFLDAMREAGLLEG